MIGLCISNMDGNTFGCKGCQEKLSSLHVEMKKSLRLAMSYLRKKNIHSAVSETDCTNIFFFGKI